jgi:hypothetical protein
LNGYSKIINAVKRQRNLGLMFSVTWSIAIARLGFSSWRTMFVWSGNFHGHVCAGRFTRPCIVVKVYRKNIFSWKIQRIIISDPSLLKISKWHFTKVWKKNTDFFSCPKNIYIIWFLLRIHVKKIVCPYLWKYILII